MQVTTRGDGKPNKSCCDRRALAETKTGGTSKKIMSQHRFKVTTRKEDIVGRKREIMSRPKINAELTCNVSARQFQVATKI